MGKVTILNHPLIDHKMSIIRDKATNTKSFRENVNEIGGLITFEITRDLPLKEVEIGYLGHQLNVEYQTRRYSQLEKFHFISNDDDRIDLYKALSSLQNELIQNKYRRENSRLIIFDVELPENIVNILDSFAILKNRLRNN